MPFKIKSSLCLGCGACANQCLFNVPKPVDAESAKYYIDPAKCVGCGQCENVCPVSAIFPLPETKRIKKVTIDKEKCIGCSICAKNCVAGAPHGQVKVPFEIDQDKCFRCGVCVKKCPKGAMKVEYVENVPQKAKGPGALMKAWCHVFHVGMIIANPFLGYRMPEYIEGAGSIKDLPKLIKEKGAGKVLIVTDNGLVKIGLPDGLCKALEENGVEYSLFSDIEPNPTSNDVEKGLKIYHETGCQAVIAFGGGSPMDCAKAICARVVHPKKTVAQLQGILTVHKKIPMLITIPTTSGTGSETTVAAVITDSETHHKASINDPALLPKYAVLDPELTIGLPPFITASTGMDALCHAVEAYTNHTYNTKLENKLAKDAVKLIYDNLLTAYNDGKNLEARQNMQKAAFFAGRAFTRGCVGYVHAIGHTLGGLYHVPHGVAMSMLLPHVMRQFGPAVYHRLSELADVCGIGGSSEKEKAEAFIAWIDDLGKQMGIPTHTDVIKDEDVDTLIKWAMAEAHPLYPVPELWGYDDFVKFIEIIRVK